MIVAAFFVVIAALVAGACLGWRLAKADHRVMTKIAEHQRGWDVSDAADSAETSADWGGEL